MNDVVELFGYPTTGGARVPWDAVVKNQQCPFVERTCIKIRKSRPDISIGTCSVLHGKEDQPIVICPLRLLQHGRVFMDCLHLLALHEPGNEIHVVPEVSVPGGSVDYVLVSARDGRVRDMVGIELQTLDTTGTVWLARQRFLTDVSAGTVREDDLRRRGYGINWKMTAKTILVQLHHKIQTFEGMGKHLVLVIQDQLLNYLRREFEFGHVVGARSGDPMHFHVYEMKQRSDGSHSLRMTLRLSTNSEGIAKCLELQAEPRVGLDKLVRQLEDKLSDRTLFRIDEEASPGRRP